MNLFLIIVEILNITLLQLILNYLKLIGDLVYMSQHTTFILFYGKFNLITCILMTL